MLMALKRKKYYIRKGRVAILLASFILGIIVCANLIPNIISSYEIAPETNSSIADVFSFGSFEIDAINKAANAEPTNIEPIVNCPYTDSSTRQFEEGLLSSDYAILIDAQTGLVLAERNGFARINPASMTKIMTLIVAVEKIEKLEQTFTVTHEILAPLYRESATMAGFVEGEQVQMIDLLYGAILPSGADATVSLGMALCGSEAAFVDCMNQKAAELGLIDTHFANTSGLYDANHYSTPADMATILEYAIKNDLCRAVLSSYQYTTNPTAEHPEGILLTSTMFGRMYGDEVENVEILGGKTGFINESGHCLASFATKFDRTYIAVTVDGKGRYQPIYDSFKIYGNYIN